MAIRMVLNLRGKGIEHLCRDLAVISTLELLLDFGIDGFAAGVLEAVVFDGEFECFEVVVGVNGGSEA